MDSGMAILRRQRTCYLCTLGDNSRNRATVSGTNASAISISSSVFCLPRLKRMLARARSESQSHGCQHVRGLNRAGRTRGARRDRKPFEVERDDHRLALDMIEINARPCSARAGAPSPFTPGFVDLSENSLLQTIAQALTFSCRRHARNPASPTPQPYPVRQFPERSPFQPGATAHAGHHKTVAEDCVPFRT